MPEWNEYPTAYAAMNKTAKDMKAHQQGWIVDQFTGQVLMPAPALEKDPTKFYAGVMSRLDLRTHGGRVTFNQWTSECRWLRASRPYYNVWPGIIKHLSKLDLAKVPVDMVTTPQPVTAFKFPKPNPEFEFKWLGTTYTLNALLLADCIEKKDSLKGGEFAGFSDDDKDDYRTLTFWMDFGERNQEHPVLLFRKLLMEPGMMVDEATDALGLDDTIDFGMRVPMETTLKAVRLVLACLLLEDTKDDDSLITPDVLSKDRQKYDATGDQKCVDRARRRGRIGFDVGRKFEDRSKSPHWRNASPAALYWTGPGKKIPKVRYRRGTFVHREKIATIPTGKEGSVESDGGNEQG